MRARICTACARLVPETQTHRGRCPACAPARRPEPDGTSAQANRAERERAYKSTEYKKARAEAIRQAGACQACGTTSDLTTHHRVPVRRGGGHTPDNLIVLCRPCHGRLEQPKAPKRSKRTRRAR